MQSTNLFNKKIFIYLKQDAGHFVILIYFTFLLEISSAFVSTFKRDRLSV